MSEATKSVSRGILPLAILLAVTFCLLVCIQILGVTPIGGSPAWNIKWVIGFANLSVYVWVRKYSGLRKLHQIATVTGVLALQLGVVACVRVDGFMGDGRLILVWRWEPTAAEAFEESSAPSRANLDTELFISDWSAFRNADRSGTTPVVVETDWAAHPPTELWRRAVGPGWSSFAVAGHRAITQEQRGELETVVCYDIRTGVELWTHSDETAFREITGGDGPRATPAISNGRVVALGATGVLNCLSLESGARFWSARIPMPPADELVFGATGSPLIVDRTVFVTPGGLGTAMVAYTLSGGDKLWASGDSAPAYSSPHLADLLRAQILNLSGTTIAGHDPATGEVLWSAPFGERSTEFVNVCQPVPLPADRRNRVLVSAGYGRGCALFELKNADDGIRVRKVWQNLNLKSKFSSIVTRNGKAYGLDERILTCVDLTTGRQHWKDGRYGHGQLILAGDTLIVLAESGAVVAVDATPSGFNERSRFRALSRRTWTHPVLAGSLLLVRNDREAACFALELRE